MFDNDKTISSKETPDVIIVGYSNNLQGGITQVTKTLLESMPQITLHNALYCYSPKYKAFLLYFYGVISFFFKIFFSFNKPVIHLIIGSKGDLVRIIPYIILSKIRRLPLCSQYHYSSDILFSNESNSYIKKIQLKLLSAIDVHCFLSQKLCKKYKELAPFDSKTVVIKNSLPPKWLGLNILNFHERNQDVVFFGRWCKEKGIEVLLKASIDLKETVKFDFYTNHLHQESYSNCTFNSWVDEDTAISIMLNSKLLILPSYAEAYPTVLIEALACGTPFISTNIAGIPDIANESNGGVIVQPGDIEEITSNITKLLSDEALWNKMSLSGYEWVNKHHSIEQIRPEWRKLFKSISA